MSAINTILKQIEANMVFIKGGTYGMEDDQNHEVNIKDFYMSRYPVTVKEYLAFVEATNGNEPEWMEADNSYNIYTGSDDYYKKLGVSIMNEQHPIVGVSWHNAMAYCEWLSEQGIQAYHLPSEAEWEYAARGGIHNSPYLYAGSNKLKEVGWYKNSHGETKTVGQKLANALGLYDISGNVWEWCLDEWEEDINKVPKDGSPAKGSRDRRVVRGGSSYSNFISCTVSIRSWYFTNNRSYNVGFRVCRY